MSWFLTLLACSKTPIPPEVAATNAAPTAPPVSTRVHMDDHLYRATAIRDAVVHGRFEDARADFAWMAEHQEGVVLPDGVTAWVSSMRDSAAAGAAAESTQAQAAALGQMATACGGCHAATGTGPKLQEPTVPVLGDSQGVHMAQHSWAHDRMWASLIEPNAGAWESALQVLSEDALPASEVANWALPQGSQAQDEQVHRLAHAALADDTPAARADLYGQIVSACATCHRASRGEAPQ